MVKSFEDIKIKLFDIINTVEKIEITTKTSYYEKQKHHHQTE